MKSINLGRMLFSILFLSTIGLSHLSCHKTDSMLIEKQPAGQLSQQVNGHAQALPHTKQYPADVATAWFQLLTDISRTKPYVPGPALRIFAYSGIALYESVVPGMPSYQSIYTHLTGDTIEADKKKDYYWPACANAAIARIATRIMEQYPAPNLTTLQALESNFNTSFQEQVSAERLQYSNDFGRHVADLLYEWSKADGTLNPNGTLALCAPYIPLGGAGNWVPTPPGYFPAVGGCQGNLRTFMPNLVHSVLVPAPPDYSTDPASAFYQAAVETYETRNQVTAAEILFINNWRDIIGTNYNPPSHALRITTTIIRKEKLNLEDAAVLLAKQTIAGFDAVVAAFHSKFRYALIRPITYVSNVLGYSGWNSTFNTVQHPSYPDELSSTASTVAILENYFGTNYSFVDSTHKTLYGEWNHSSLNAMLEDIVQSRVSSGTNFRFAGEAGVVQGRAIGQLADQLPFKKP